MHLLEMSGVTLERDNDIAKMFTLSPFVWRNEDGYNLLLRCVPHEKDPARKIASIFYGRGSNGRHFRMDPNAVLASDTMLGESISFSIPNGTSEPAMAIFFLQPEPPSDRVGSKGKPFAGRSLASRFSEFPHSVSGTARVSPRNSLTA